MADERFCVFIAVGQTLNLVTPSNSVNGEPPICWVRAQLVDCNGKPFPEKIVETSKRSFKGPVSFNMIPMMLGDVHRVGIQIEDIEDTVDMSLPRFMPNLF
jgi:hypothetical protein